MSAGGLNSNPALHGRSFMGNPTFPTWLTDFVDEIKTKKECERSLASGPTNDTGKDHAWTYCGDYVNDAGLIYITGPNGQLPQMHTDCDGHRGGEKGVCDQIVGPDGWRNETAFQPLVKSLGHGLVDLDPYVHPYVVLGNTGEAGGTGDTTIYDPKTHLIQPLSLVAVFCGDDTVRYGIWGDYGRPSRPWVGQVSPAMESLCRGSKSAQPADKADEEGVLIVAFNGRQAVPGPMGANWDAKTPGEFSDSMHILGDTMMKRIYRRPKYSSASPSPVRCVGRIFATSIVALTMAHAMSIISLF